ncbi:hypothetical protein [Catellatospora methionotrophica]|uniref:hypothetical protein n=1 Tax=Catellatospora methionotrophica TaxID=121620 RepID=UPI0033D32F63
MFALQGLGVGELVGQVGEMVAGHAGQGRMTQDAAVDAGGAVRREVGVVGAEGYGVGVQGVVPVAMEVVAGDR